MSLPIIGITMGDPAGIGPEVIVKSLVDENLYYGRNFPHSGFHFNYTLDRHSGNGEIDNICIEFRNDLLCSKKRIKKYIEIFGDIFSGLLK